MGQLVFQATLGGQVNLVGPNTASTFNLNVPAVSSTLATLTGTETFTNKTLTSPTLTTPVLGTPSSGTLTNCTGLTQSGLATGVAGTGPAFSAYQNASVSIATGTFVKLPINTKTFDTATAFDAATNYRFTPLVGGYYQINGCMNYMAGTGGGNLFVSIYKNGSEYRRGAAQTVVGGISSNVSDVVYLNGSSDYVELYVYQSSGITQTYNPATPLTYFSGAMIRGA
jgi:hypothetical protein